MYIYKRQFWSDYSVVLIFQDDQNRWADERVKARKESQGKRGVCRRKRWWWSGSVLDLGRPEAVGPVFFTAKWYFLTSTNCCKMFWWVSMYNILRYFNFFIPEIWKEIMYRWGICIMYRYKFEKNFVVFSMCVLILYIVYFFKYLIISLIWIFGIPRSIFLLH